MLITFLCPDQVYITSGLILTEENEYGDYSSIVCLFHVTVGYISVIYVTTHMHVIYMHMWFCKCDLLSSTNTLDRSRFIPAKESYLITVFFLGGGGGNGPLGNAFGFNAKDGYFSTIKPRMQPVS